ncbi:MAG: nucleotidyltransferase domain-containing protein [Phycisphaerales bacterium]
MVQAQPQPPLGEIVETIRRELAPRRVTLFGSRATGVARPDSDVDLLIEMETTLCPAERMRGVSRLFPARRWSLDALVFTPEELALARRSPGSVVARMEREGRVLYARP